MKTSSLAVAAIVSLAALGSLRAQSPRVASLDSVTIADLNIAFDAGTLTSEQLVAMCVARIQAYDRQGPTLRSLIAVNPKAIETARQLDRERK